ncbi:hypothetical protein OHV13_06940 [Kitasatospora purpeofusca]|uniref:hypothetical protein n=1 Tax=Kitasatospora purpeofusca TaxID=67352 RepID=UPI0032493686
MIVDRIRVHPQLVHADDRDEWPWTVPCVGALLTELGRGGAQVICATHSPILPSVPGAAVLEVGEQGIQQTRWQDLAIVDHSEPRMSRHRPGIGCRGGGGTFRWRSEVPVSPQNSGIPGSHSPMADSR